MVKGEAARSQGASPARRITRRGGGKQRILHAALDLFADLGFDAVSTADIAKVAGTSQSVVLYHFSTKDQLWREAMRLLFEQIDARPTFESAVYKDLDPLSRLKVLLRRFVLVSARHPQLGRVMFREGLNGGERMGWLLSELASPQYNIFTSLITEGVESGALKPYPPAMVSLLMHGAGATLFNLSALSRELTGQDPFAAEVVDQQADMVVDILLGGLLRRAN